LYWESYQTNVSLHLLLSDICDSNEGLTLLVDELFMSDWAVNSLNLNPSSLKTMLRDAAINKEEGHKD
jgi:hypothetical protein